MRVKKARFRLQACDGSPGLDSNTRVRKDSSDYTRVRKSRFRLPLHAREERQVQTGRNVDGVQD